MKDDNGFYYYPFPDNKRVRMYVKKEMGTVFFRLWNADDALLWQEHGWVPYDAIKKATEMYNKKSGFNPEKAYDIVIATAILNEADNE